MLPRLLAFTLILSTGSPLQARVGETLAECKKRYGTPSPASQELPPTFRNDVGTIQVFNPDGWEIWTCIVDDICVLQLYRKALTKEFRLPIFEDEESIIKDAESGGQKWQESGTGKSTFTDPKTGFTREIVSTTWRTVEGTFLLLGDNRSHILISHRRWHWICEEADARARSERLKRLEKF